MSASSSSSTTPKRDVRMRLLIVHGLEHGECVAEYLVRKVWAHEHGRDWIEMAYYNLAVSIAEGIYGIPNSIEENTSIDRPIPEIANLTAREVVSRINQLLDSDNGRSLLPRPLAGKTMALEALVGQLRQRYARGGRPDIVLLCDTQDEADLLRAELPRLFPRVAVSALSAADHTPTPDEIAEALKNPISVVEESD